MKLLISALRTPIWKISENDYIEALKEKFKGCINITEIINPERKFKYEWVIKDNNYFLEGSIDRQFTGVCFETNSDALALITTNLTRKFMPKDAQILIYNEDFSISYEVPFTGIDLAVLHNFS